MSNYKGLFTFDVDSHNYVAVVEAVGLITNIDYKPSEPVRALIKDEKMRKAVRAWAEANNVNLVRIVGVRTLQSEHQGIEIEFNADLFVGWVTALKTIPELCGEKEE